MVEMSDLLIEGDSLFFLSSKTLVFVSMFLLQYPAALLITGF